ncbi:hypothetical protein P886_5008 [Alteromonadaceae bacterium 2753L.S.0a.02]|nr:hypothetical protein P886_5008 [Alteromonadaceae bacterium 2753L.S.0a.02]
MLATAGFSGSMPPPKSRYAGTVDSKQRGSVPDKRSGGGSLIARNGKRQS